MNITKIFNEVNWQILEIAKSERLNLRDMAKRLKRTPATIHYNLNFLKAFGLVRIEKEKNQYMIVPNTESHYYRLFMQLINYEKVEKCKSLKELEKRGIVGIYGSFARGMDDKDSDIDLFVFTQANEIAVREIVNKMSRETGKEINILTLNEKKLKELKNNDYEFYIRLKLESIMFNGDIFA
jgi:predicted nucleotidyltransferase